MNSNMKSNYKNANRIVCTEESAQAWMRAQKHTRPLARSVASVKIKRFYYFFYQFYRTTMTAIAPSCIAVEQKTIALNCNRIFFSLAPISMGAIFFSTSLFRINLAHCFRRLLFHSFSLFSLSNFQSIHIHLLVCMYNRHILSFCVWELGMEKLIEITTRWTRRSFFMCCVPTADWWCVCNFSVCLFKSKCGA